MSSLLSLLVVCLLAASASARTSPTNGNSDGQGCQAALSYASVQMPPQAELIWRIELTGTRNFSCRGGLEFGPALGVAEGELDGLECKLWYESPFLGKAVCIHPSDGREVGHSTLDTTVKGAVFVLPAPNTKEDDAWGRFKITTEGVLAPANYMVRYNTSGGVHPKQCTAKPGEWQLVPFTATYDGYLCQE